MIRKLGIILEMIKVEHTIFALPFAFMGALLGAVMMEKRLPEWGEIGWIILAMVGARSAAMGLNRVIDSAIDKKNPRTAKRAIPAGLLKVGEVLLFIAVAFVLLFFAAAKLNPICLKLMPIAVFMLVLYSYTKRFTWLCHVVLGLTIGLAPLGAWVAITGHLDLSAWVLYIAVATWLAGFDIIYACQDFDFDRKEGVHSIPARFGLIGALRIAKVFHFITAIGFIALFWMTDLSWGYLVGTIIAAGILFYEHWLVKPSDMSRVQTAFFTMNGALSTVLFVFTFLDLVVLHKW
ncbi:4-hydroxybenzoate octaprenyltransferase [Paenibacillus baekrokdamisoli]|uniref:4-hydroxybenzoate polyprenyltransferase n=1 Tax=Paenibacillus baekrokdamisoli TaxID=1712516 RepID=A0A3G9IXW6_9BACL|nr:UbiA-like polyprenyltransferase [Paenibacillus baekrokdamisoli]MBB3069651.1 4-hydroxybenzoate polyprenyltransferase [Paenibacillus baekrokdamisoli]BBH20995.1 4-hydroxybenzoate octaprenyltransferase [Paenibacillus baekrokdamisoli]